MASRAPDVRGSAKGTDAALGGPEQPQPPGPAEGKLCGVWALRDPCAPEPSAAPALELIACGEILPPDSRCWAVLADNPRS